MRTFGLSGLQGLNHGSELKRLWHTFGSQITELWFPYERRIANDRRQSQTIAKDRIWFYLLRSSAITITGLQMISDNRRSVFPYDGRQSQNFLRLSAIIHIILFFFFILLIFISSKLHTFFINKHNSHKRTDTVHHISTYTIHSSS